MDKPADKNDPIFGGPDTLVLVVQQQQHTPAPEPPKLVAKGPITSEHQVLQDIFDKLVKSCAQIALNAQMKHKLDDVARKLDILYDKLREHQSTS